MTRKTYTLILALIIALVICVGKCKSKKYETIQGNKTRSIPQRQSA
jgi:hypothetical protein